MNTQTIAGNKTMTHTTNKNLSAAIRHINTTINALSVVEDDLEVELELLELRILRAKLNTKLIEVENEELQGLYPVMINAIRTRAGVNDKETFWKGYKFYKETLDPTVWKRVRPIFERATYYQTWQRSLSYR